MQIRVKVVLSAAIADRGKVYGCLVGNPTKAHVAARASGWWMPHATSGVCVIARERQLADVRQ